MGTEVLIAGGALATGAILGALAGTEEPETPKAPKPPPGPSDEEVARAEQDAAYQSLKKRGRAANILSPSMGGGLQDNNPTLAGKSLLG